MEKEMGQLQQMIWAAAEMHNSVLQERACSVQGAAEHVSRLPQVSLGPGPSQGWCLPATRSGQQQRVVADANARSLTSCLIFQARMPKQQEGQR
jgi:hypothetical protein